MRRLFAWTAGLVGIAALGRLLASRRARHPAPALAPPRQEQDPAEELRRRLAESRDDTGSAAESASTAPTEPLEERRARVHAKAQEAMSEMDALEEPGA